MHGESVIKLDIDTKKYPADQIDHVIWYLKNYNPKLEFQIERFQTHKGWHVRIKVNSYLSDKDILISQLLCGSDYKRELRNYVRILSGKFKNQEWNVLFCEKMKYDKKSGKLRTISREKAVV